MTVKFIILKEDKLQKSIVSSDLKVYEIFEK